MNHVFSKMSGLTGFWGQQKYLHLVAGKRAGVRQQLADLVHVHDATHPCVGPQQPQTSSSLLFSPISVLFQPLSPSRKFCFLK